MAKPEERPVRALRRISGPLGIWSFPLLNFVLEFVGTARARGFSSGAPPSPKTAYSNIETYEIFEDRAGVIRVRVHRKAERA